MAKNKKKPDRLRLRTQLSLAFPAAALVTIGLVSILANIFINQKFKDYISTQNDMRAEEIAASIGPQYLPEEERWNVDFVHGIGMYALYDGYIIKVYDLTGKTVWDAEAHDMSLCSQIMEDISYRMMVKYPRASGTFQTLHYNLTQNNDKVGTMSIQYYGPFFLSESDFQFLNSLNLILVGTAVLSLLLALVMGWFLARGISRPVTEIADITKNISDGNYTARFHSDSRTEELHDLIFSVNELAARLEQQEQLQKQLTSDVAHELRTPLTTIGTHLEAMIEGIWEPSPDRLNSCHEEILRITNLVKDLEKLTAVEAENLKLNKSLVSLKEITQTATDILALDIEKKELHIDIEGTPPYVYADKDRIAQVTLNLLSNAVKYIPTNGSIRILFSESEESLIMKIKDSGPGISEEDLPHIFDRFYRVEKSRNRKTGGAGIGLTITKSIVNAHGGTITAESVPGQSTCFTVTLPKEPVLPVP